MASPGRHELYWAMPDVGDVLGDESLAQPSFRSGYSSIGGRIFLLVPEVRLQEELVKSVEDCTGVRLRRVAHTDDVGPFNMSPPPSRLVIDPPSACSLHEENLKQWLSSPSLSSLDLEFPAIEHVRTLLHIIRPPNCAHHLRSLTLHLSLHNYMEEIAELLCESPASATLLSNIRLHVGIYCDVGPLQSFTDRQSTAISKLAKRCSSFTIITSGVGCAVHAHTLGHLMLFDTSSSQLQQLSSYAVDCLYYEYDESVFPSLTHPSSGPFVGIDASVLKRVESCRLKRLDMRGWQSLGPEGMSVLIASLASPACSIHDLGINLTSALPHWHHTRLAILAQAFRSGSSLNKLKVLRFAGVDSNEAAACVADILASPQGNCKVRFLELDLFPSQYSHSYEPFFKKLQQVSQPRIECLRVFMKGVFAEWDETSLQAEMLSLCGFLGQEQCPLLWLQWFRYSAQLFSSMPEDLQMKLANSLEANFRLNFLYITQLDSPAATSRASAFLARNHLYKAMGLSKDDYMKPQVARLFLCGNGEVGKTTLRKALVSQLHNRSRGRAHSSPSPSTPSPYAGCTSNVSVCLQACEGSPQHQDVEPRTRGLEIHQLSFGPDQNLAVFDLGGQSDYHHFHHYLMANTSHDLFIVVCRYPSELASHAEYWLRFIVSHRTSVEGPKPRILLVVNFTKGSFPPGEMKQFADNETEKLLFKYRGLLDFGAQGHQRVFGIVAVDTSQAGPILEMLEVVLAELLEHRPLIPKLCDDLLSNTLPLLAKEKKQSRWGFLRQLHGDQAREGIRKLAFKRVIVDFDEVKDHYVQQQDQAHRSEAEVRKIERRLQASVTELHNAGEVVFFPPVLAVLPNQVESRSSDVFNRAKLEGSIEPAMEIEDTTETSSLEKGGVLSPVIVDPNWFYNKVIGNLLAPESLLGGRSKWTESQIKQVLIESGCPVQYINEVLRYILSLDLCFCFCEKRGTKSETKYFFPAVASEKELHWPPSFIGYQSSTSSRDSNNTMHFYGRRIKCRDTGTHLIPSGVFTRLQVKLQTFCGVGNERSYRFGYHWASFVKSRVSVMVRFGRVTARSDQSSTLIPATSMQEDNHPEWIDILLSCPSSVQDSQVQAATSVEDTIMQQIKKIIFDICQATSRGIPTVVLEEWALRHAALDDAMQLTEIEECIQKYGLASDVSWEDQQSTPLVDLLLPEELRHHVASHVQAIQKVQEEFLHIGDDGDDPQLGEGSSKELGKGNQHSGESKIMYDLITNLDRKMDKVLALVQEIKQDVHKVLQNLQQMEVSIVAKCSTGLLQQLLLHHVLPAYSYLTNSEGKMQRLRFFQGSKATVHFLCESDIEGPHVVEGQKGREVVVERGILVKWAPFLIPSLMVLCCAARFAANVYLPGVAPLFFDPFLKFLNAINITAEDLKSEIIPKAVDALFDQLDVRIQGLHDQKAPFIKFGKEQQRDGVEALQNVLGSIQDLNMEKDFGLHLCSVQDGQRAKWLCKEHAKAHMQLKQQHPNPFSNIAN